MVVAYHLVRLSIEGIPSNTSIVGSALDSAALHTGKDFAVSFERTVFQK